MVRIVLLRIVGFHRIGLIGMPIPSLSPSAHAAEVFFASFWSFVVWALLQLS